MKRRTKLFFWISTICCIILIFMTSGIFSLMEVEETVVLNEINTANWDEYLLKIGISVMLLVIAFFSSSWYNAMMKANKEVTNAVTQLTLQTKLLQQTNKQIMTDVAIITKRQNRLIDWKNKHSILHASCVFFCPNTK